MHVSKIRLNLNEIYFYLVLSSSGLIMYIRAVMLYGIVMSSRLIVTLVWCQEEVTYEVGSYHIIPMWKTTMMIFNNSSQVLKLCVLQYCSYKVFLDRYMSLYRTTV